MPLLVLLPLLLLNAPLVMDAVSDSCRLFVTAVLPGLFPYLVLVQLFVPRLSGRCSPTLLLLCGWGGGSPTGAGLLSMQPSLAPAMQRRLAVACATMSPMFLLGTLGQWLGSTQAATCVFIAVLAGGWLAGALVQLLPPHSSPARAAAPIAPPTPLSFGQAVEAAARTMLLVCGTMAMLRAAAALCAHYLSAWPGLCLWLQTMLQVTSGTVIITALPLPLAWRIALTALATGFGGVSILLQNRALLPPQVLSPLRQVLAQALHAVLSFLLALGLALLAGLG